jgi:endonuclease/exonuclease/phosphatase family metal-dependent hydrolase
MAVFYRRDRFEPLEYDHYWLSDTPDVMGSSTWGNSNRRMVTWVRFKDRETAREFYFVNTHLDHQIQVAREKSADLIRQRLATFRPELPLLLVGDFNAVAGANRVYDILVGDSGLRDLWTAAKERREPMVNTFHAFRGPMAGTNRIDWILGKQVTAEAAQIITCSKDGVFPSDHFPVVAWVNFNGN